jgi:D-alanyl-D-alanine carboxypeptidase
MKATAVRMALAGVLTLAGVYPALADDVPNNDFKAQVDAVVTADLTRTGVPSASIALVRNRAIVYAQAYGLAEISPKRAAAPAMRYAIGSISKQFTASAVLLQQERGALSLDDTAGKWLPNLGPASSATLRALLSHTAGVRDYWPQDYDPPEMLRPINPTDILARWANRPLDFPSGTAWQYSNTGYTASALIVEKTAKQPLYSLLSEKIFKPLGMDSVRDFDAGKLPADDAVGYTRAALGPFRPAAKEAKGWLFGAGGLAMTASDLARWDISVIEQKVLSPASYRELEKEVLLVSGVGSGYGLGMQVRLESGQRVLKHGGEVGGFTSHNRVYPELGAAIVVLTNLDATNAPEIIADDLARLVLSDNPDNSPAATREAMQILEGLQQGHIDSKILTANARSYFTAETVKDFADSLGPLGNAQQFTFMRSEHRGGLITRLYRFSLGGRACIAIVRAEPAGMIEQYTISVQ